MRTRKLNSLCIRWFFYVALLCPFYSVIGQNAGNSLLNQISKNVAQDKPEANDTFILSYRKGKYNHLQCDVKGKILHQLGLGLYYQNREKEAITIFKDAVEKEWKNCNAIGPTEKANTLFNIGVCYQYTEEATKGKSYIENAMRILVADKTYAREALCTQYQAAGNYYSTIKDFTKAEFYYKAAERLASSIPTEDQFHLYNEIFVLYLNFAEWDKALDKATFLRKFVEKNATHVDPLSKAILHINLAELYLKTGNADKVPEACEKALALLTDEDAEFISNAHEILGVYFLEKKNYAQSKYHYELAFEKRSQSDNIVQANLAKAFSIENLAEISLKENDFDKALELINQSIKILSGPCATDQNHNPVIKNCINPNGIHLIRELMLKQRIYHQLDRQKPGSLLKAALISPKLDSLAGIVLEQVYLDDSKLYLLAQLNDKTDLQLETSLALYKKTGDVKYLKSSSQFVSASKSFVLKQFLDQNKLLYLKKGNDKFSKLFQYREELNNIRTRIESSETIEDTLFAKANSLMARLEEEERNLGLSNQTTLKNNFTITQSPESIPSGHVVIESYCGAEWLHFFTHRKTGLHHYQYKRKEIEGWLSNVKTSLLNPTVPYDSKSAAKLWSTCFAQMIFPEDDRVLVFIPDGILHGLPIEALIDKDGNYIVEKFQVQYGHSSEIMSAPKNPARYSKELVGFATTYSDQLNARIRGITYFKGLQLNPLNSAVDELKKGSEPFSHQLYLGADAKAEAFKKHGQDSRILYFSLHGIANEKNGSLSALLFDDTQPDFVLHSYEINAIPLNAELVVLSSCQSAGGKIISGEGIQGLTRSFLLAGCQQVVSSFWNASEQSAAAILTPFMSMVAEKTNPAEALTKAKRDYLTAASPSLRHPYYWAGFVVTGQLQKADETFPMLIVTAMAILVVISGIWLYRRKKSRI